MDEISRILARTVSRAFPDDVWVEGEIRDLKRPPVGHVYFTLVDPAADAEPVPALPVTLFAPDRDAVNRILTRSGAMRMTDGVHVRIRGRVNHYAPRGTVQLRMTWIDTDYTVGKLAAERRALLQRLEAAGHMVRNARRPVPLVPLRIGLVTSAGSAAHADFIGELTASGYAFHLLEADVRVQGPDAPTSIEAALAALGRHEPDLVAVVRGGGAQTDLAAFDTERVALAIAAAPFPVFTGIGHEIDTTVADHVAGRNLKTPTACAQAIVGIMQVFEARLTGIEQGLGPRIDRLVRRVSAEASVAERRLSTAVRLRLSAHDAAVSRRVARLRTRTPRTIEGAAARVGAVAARVEPASRTAVAGGARGVDAAMRRLRLAAPRVIVQEERRLDADAAVLRAHEPDRMLARGWSLTYGPGGRLVRDKDDVVPGDTLRTRTAGGIIASTVDNGDDDTEMT